MQAGLDAMGLRTECRGTGGLPTLRLLYAQATPYVKTRLGAVMLLVVGAAVLTALGPVALRWIVDRLVARGGRETVSPVTLATLYVLALWLARTANEVRGLVFARAEQRIFRTLSEQLFSHLMHLPLAFHLNRQTGALSQILDNGLQGLRIILHRLVFIYVPVAVELGTILVVLVRVATGQFILMFCGALGCYIVVFAYSAAVITKTARRASGAGVDATAMMTDGLLNYETVKYFTAEEIVTERVSRALGRSEREWVDFYRRYALNGLVVAGVFGAFLAGTVVCATEEVLRGRLTVGEFVLINTYMLEVIRPVEMMGYAMQGLSHGTALLENLLRLFQEPAEPTSNAGRELHMGPGSVAFRGVCISFGVNRPVLREVSFRVAAGRTLGIVGPSGSGKSTVVRLLMRLLDPEKGEIVLDGVPISGMPLRELRSSIAVVAQDTALFNDTLRYNIAFGRANASVDEIEQAARIAQLHDFIMTLPDGYDTVVGERGVKLSGGERQRVSIARAVLKAPRIYIFDEATSSLDSHTEREILEHLVSISKGVTTLVIAHRLSTVVHADEIVVLENGEIAERGTHQALLRQNGKYAALWKAQQDGLAAV